MRKRAVVEALSGYLTEGELGSVLSGVDIIGDIAVVKIPRALEGRGNKIGELLLERLGVGAVYRQTTPAAMGTKVRGIQWLAGRTGTETRHRESGCTFKLDLSKVYFSPRLSHERMRIARLVRPGEIVVNMFAGVGTFSIVIAKNSGASLVYSIDRSRDAFGYMVENIRINGLEGRVVPVEGDARDVVAGLRGSADRVLMPLPELALGCIPHALSCLRKGGTAHVYLHQRAGSREEALDRATGDAVGRVAVAGGVVASSKARIVRSVGRNIFQIAVDIEIAG